MIYCLSITLVLFSQKNHNYSYHFKLPFHQRLCEGRVSPGEADYTQRCLLTHRTTSQPSASRTPRPAVRMPMPCLTAVSSSLSGRPALILSRVVGSTGEAKDVFELMLGLFLLFNSPGFSRTLVEWWGRFILCVCECVCLYTFVCRPLFIPLLFMCVYV